MKSFIAMNIILFDDHLVKNFYPLSLTRPIAEFRWGIFTIKEKWEKTLNVTGSYLTQVYLQEKYALCTYDGEHKIYLNARHTPTKELVEKIKKLAPGQVIQEGTEIIATSSSKIYSSYGELAEDVHSFEKIAHTHTSSAILINTWDLFQKNGDQIAADIELLKKAGTKFIKPSTSNQILGNQVFIEEGASVECSILNSNTGPIYIAKGAEIMEGCMVRGPFALCEGAGLKMGAKIYGATTIGPHCKIGGEINNSVIFGYSNKAHDGFLGNSVLGEWCNLGADTNNSNLKNNYGEVDVWSYQEQKYINTKNQFIGLTMGDHSKAGINTMFNTGTVVGIFANIYGGDFPEKFIPDFSWGSKGNWKEHGFNKAMEMAQRVMERRKIALTKADKAIYEAVKVMSEA